MCFFCFFELLFFIEYLNEFDCLQQANQTGSSNSMELAGAKLCFKYLKDSGLQISSFISDRHRGIGKWIRESQTETQHFHDLWHIVKGMSKKVIKISKEKGNEKLQVWLKAIRSHLYWCVLSSKQGYGDIILAKWKSVVRHISNKHVDHPDPLYANCAHGPLEPRDWIKPGNELYKKYIQKPCLNVQFKSPGLNIDLLGTFFKQPIVCCTTACISITRISLSFPRHASS